MTTAGTSSRRGSGPTSVVTDLGTYVFDEETGEMTIATLHPGVTLEQVRANMGWEPKVDRREGLRRTLDYFRDKVQAK